MIELHLQHPTFPKGLAAQSSNPLIIIINWSFCRQLSPKSSLGTHQESPHYTSITQCINVL